MSEDDFYEEDEPLEKIKAIIARGPDGFTSRPGDAVALDVQTVRGVVITGARFTASDASVDVSRVRITQS